MGLYRTVNAQLDCDYCKAPRKTTVQFRTGTDNLEEYEVGQRVEALPELDGERAYDANAERYCKSCLKKRKVDEFRTLYDALAELVDSGQLQMSRGLLLKKPASPAEIREIGEDRRRDFETGNAKAEPLFNVLRDYALVWQGEKATQGEAAYSNLLERLNERMGDKMRAYGWDRRGLFRELIVFQDEDSVIQVEAV